MSETLKRITAEMVREAYAKTGLKPLRRTSYVSGGGCCAIGALARASDPTCNPPMWAFAHYDSKYIFGFTRGFDGDDYRRDSESIEGYLDGQAVAAAIFGQEQSV